MMDKRPFIKGIFKKTKETNNNQKQQSSTNLKRACVAILNQI